MRLAQPAPAPSCGRRAAGSLLAVVCSLLGLCLAAPAARADAWSAAERVMPGGMIAVIKIDTKAFRGMATPEAMTRLADSIDAEEPLELLTKCGIDVTTAIDQVVIAMDYQYSSLLFMSGPGLVDATIRCIEEKRKFRAERDGNLVHFVKRKGSSRDRALIAVYGDTLVMDTDWSDQAVRNYLPGRGVARDAILARALNRIDRSAPAFAFYAGPTKLRQLTRSSRPGPRRLARRAVDLLYWFEQLTGSAGVRLGSPDPFLLAQAADYSGSSSQNGDDEEEADDDDDPGDVELKYAALELTGGSTLRLRIFATTSHAGMATNWLRDEDLQRLVSKINGTSSIRDVGDGLTVEWIVTFPRGVLENAMREFD